MLVVPMKRVVSEAYRRLGIRVTVLRLPLTRSRADANAGYFAGETESSAYMHRATVDAVSWAAPQIQPLYHFLHQRHARAGGSIASVWAEATGEEAAP